ncbi:MAG: 3'-5' exonuclease [Candidatus Kaiserbacteria bacterium]|nr:3'-5' exonuclease [Candidatus Kaiserbacteria bacterium]
MHKYIALDTETTGVDFCTSQVIQCAVIFLDDALQPVARRSWDVNFVPEKFSWDTVAAEVHGIGRDVVEQHGVDPEQFLREFEQDIVKHYGVVGGESAELHVIAANAYFDYLMLELLWSTYRPDEEVPISRRVVDLSSLSLFVLGVSGMSTVLETLGIAVTEEDRHSALYDAELHLKIFHSLATIASREGISLS